MFLSEAKTGGMFLSEAKTGGMFLSEEKNNVQFTIHKVANELLTLQFAETILLKDKKNNKKVWNYFQMIKQML